MGLHGNSVYSDALAETILSRMANGESLRAICDDPGIPCIQTVLRWKDDPQHAAFASRYARAREAQAEFMDHRILSEADGCTVENAAAVRVKIDAYKWRAAKLAPKTYGDKLTHSGDAENPLEIVTASNRDRAKALAALLAKQAREK